MVEYICDTCKKVFLKKYNYDIHVNRQTSCVLEKETKKKNKFECKSCRETFCRNDALNKHLKICKNKINSSCNKYRYSNKAKIEGNNNETLIDNQIENNVTINLIFFTKDGTKTLTPNELADILKSNSNLFESMISTINFNPKKPQHHNVYYPDIKSAYGIVYENNKWTTKKINEILNLLLDAKTEDLNDLLNNMGDVLSKKTRNKIKEAIENADYTKPNERKKLMAYLKLILFNNKEMVIGTRKKTEDYRYDEVEDTEDIEDEDIVGKPKKKHKQI